MLEFVYLLLSVALLSAIIYAANFALKRTIGDSRLRKANLQKLIIGLLLWQVYVFGISSTGILQDFSLPPRFPIFLVLPAFIFTGIFIYRNRSADWVVAIPPKWLIYIQVFRVVVESLFVWSVAQEILHPEVTIEGYNFDMIIGITAPIIGYLVFTQKILSTKAAIFWNYFGLAVLASVIFVFVSTIYFPELYGAKEPMAPKEFAMYPFTLVAAFLMPAAVFIHILSIVQLKRMNQKTPTE